MRIPHRSGDDAHQAGSSRYQPAARRVLVGSIEQATSFKLRLLEISKEGLVHFASTTVEEAPKPQASFPKRASILTSAGYL